MVIHWPANLVMPDAILPVELRPPLPLLPSRPMEMAALSSVLPVLVAIPMAILHLVLEQSRLVTPSPRDLAIAHSQLFVVSHATVLKLVARLAAWPLIAILARAGRGVLPGLPVATPNANELPLR